jgi:hypothetical protein
MLEPLCIIGEFYFLAWRPEVVHSSSLKETTCCRTTCTTVQLPLGHGSGIYILASEATSTIPAHQFHLRKYQVFWDYFPFGHQLRNTEDLFFRPICPLALAVYIGKQLLVPKEIRTLINLK